MLAKSALRFCEMYCDFEQLAKGASFLIACSSFLVDMEMKIETIRNDFSGCETSYHGYHETG